MVTYHRSTSVGVILIQLREGREVVEVQVEVLKVRKVVEYVGGQADQLIVAQIEVLELLV